uniref:Uncharacterized protein n=1 Tax=Ditylenchus dipsaci TaxID=166011 RepID=A0A915CU29_9BILA
MTPPGDEFFVQGHQYLSTVGYSYWTLGYALSQTGAKKLLDANPLKKLMALDEFLPIMYDKHPNEGWKKHFDGHRTLLAFTVYPVIVQPERYTHEPGYVSDTEGSTIIANFGKNTTPTLSAEEVDEIEQEKRRNKFFSQIDTTGNDEL